MSIIDFSSAEKYISNLENKGERQKLLSLAESLPYQVINDSPTVKHYTEWSEYDKLNLTIFPSKEEIKKKYELEGYRTIYIQDDFISGGLVSEEPTNSLIKPEEHKLVALTLALSRKIKIDIEKSDKVLIYHRVAERNYFSPANIEINVKDGAITDIVYLAENEIPNSLQTAITSLRVSRDSQANFTLISTSSYIYNYVKVYCEGELNSTIFATKSKMAHIEYTTILDKESKSVFSAKSIGTNDDKIDIRIIVQHQGQKSVSDGNLKGIATDNAFVVIRGDASINETALDSSTSIIGRAFILGKDAKAIVAPMLEVKTGRVMMAKHSASVSRVPEDLIFYLENRGLSRKEAESFLIRGFIEDEKDPEILKKIIEEVLTSSKIIVSV
ncbi:SufD family Fe-S cluster assembly protein [Sulfurisphaera javensis]|uniref:SufD family Fe-S cluster assembly protein n=1 Tax=Sulfurisphaera javensis TaxID=2049879 RepID=A0AAT9GTK5_9CREN